MTDPERPSPAVEDLSYEQAAAELDGIIDELDHGLVDVDALEQRFRRAIDIVEELDKRIRSARDRVDALIPRLDAIAEEVVDRGSGEAE